MDINIISPYIRRAIYSVMRPSNNIETRVIYDHEIIYVKSGKCLITVNGNEYLCRKNNVIFLPPGIPHGFCTPEGSEFNQPHIHFDAVYSEKSTMRTISFKNITEMTDEERNLIDENIFKDISVPYVFTPENPDRFQKIFFSIVEDFENSNCMTLYSKAKMTELLHIIISRFSSISQQNTPYTPASNIKNYIDGNFRNIITLEFLSDFFHVNKFTMMRNFKKEYGLNIIEYYNKKRADYSKHLLLTTNMTIKAVGESLNFTDSYSFSRFFKNQTGVSPLYFRK